MLLQLAAAGPPVKSPLGDIGVPATLPATVVKVATVVVETTVAAGASAVTTASAIAASLLRGSAL